MGILGINRGRGYPDWKRVEKKFRDERCVKDKKRKIDMKNKKNFLNRA